MVNNSIVDTFSADIVRARLRTMGVDEHRFVIERGLSATFRTVPGFATPVPPGNQTGTEWCFFDVGGSRCMVRYLQGFLRESFSNKPPAPHMDPLL